MGAASVTSIASFALLTTALSSYSSALPLLLLFSTFKPELSIHAKVPDTGPQYACGVDLDYRILFRYTPFDPEGQRICDLQYSVSYESG